MAYINASRISATRPARARHADVDDVRSDRSRAVLAVLRTAWQAAWGDDAAPDRDPHRDISFLP